MNWFSVCDVSYGQVFTVGICITKAYEAVSYAEMYAVRGCECRMNNEQPNVVGAGTSVNKEYWKSKAASDSFCIFLERDPWLQRATNSCNLSRASQTVTNCTYRFLFYGFEMVDIMWSVNLIKFFDFFVQQSRVGRVRNNTTEKFIRTVKLNRSSAIPVGDWTLLFNALENDRDNVRRSLYSVYNWNRKRAGRTEAVTFYSVGA